MGRYINIENVQFEQKSLGIIKFILDLFNKNCLNPLNLVTYIVNNLCLVVHLIVEVYSQKYDKIYIYDNQVMLISFNTAIRKSLVLFCCCCMYIKSSNKTSIIASITVLSPVT